MHRPERSTGLELAINKYGIEQFDFTIVEECLAEELNEKEVYWIEFYDSYNNGYNLTKGGKSLYGSEHPRALLTEEDVWIIREMYAMGLPRNEAYQSFDYSGITPRGFKKIWDGENWTHIHMDVYTEANKELHKHNSGHSADQIGLSSLDRAIKQQEIDLMVADYKQGMSIQQISNKYGRDYGIVQKYLANPVETKKVNYLGRILKNVNTGKIFNSISAAAKWAGCGATTLTRHLNTDKIAGKVPETNEPAIWIEIS